MINSRIADMYIYFLTKKIIYVNDVIEYREFSRTEYCVQFVVKNNKHLAVGMVEL